MVNARRTRAMRRRPGSETPYQERHGENWPDTIELMNRQGIRNFSICRHGSLHFVCQESEWETMAPTMETSSDLSPVMELVEEMLHFAEGDA
jgi:L-rhamnose mutarotase